MPVKAWRKILFTGAMAVMLIFTALGSSCAPSVDDLPMKTFSDAEFLDPDVAFRPIPVIHSNLDKAAVFNLKGLGYGGVVTNVSFAQYLVNDEMWSDFEDLVKYTIEDQGLRMWIYDERGYPSGSAGGLVLKDNMDWQAKGIVCLNVVSEGKETLTIRKPYGHIACVAAFAFRGTSVENIDYAAYQDLSDRLDSDGTLSWTAPEAGWTAVCVYSKNFFENTHAAFNWAEVRRYIDLLDPDPVRKFIDVTYQRYFDHVGQYFGKGIEAFFTDEPSLMGTYFVDPPPTTPAVIDAPDPAIPLLTTANYGDKLLDEFKKRRGYEAAKYLPLLFSENSEEALKFRWDYYRTLSELVAENYTGQIGKFCDEHGIAMSGHLLFEEDISKHPIFEGDYLQIMKNMQYPGIDLLTSHPETALGWASTAVKFASSAADYSKREKVMSEVSDAFDGTKGSVMDRIGSVAVQYALGVSQINSYYPINNMTEDENRLFTNTIGRFGYMLDGGKHIARVAVYYPIEGIWTQTTAPENLYSFNKSVSYLSDNFRELSVELLKNQIDYDYLDFLNLQGCRLKDGKIITPGNSEYSVLVIPQTPALSAGTIDFLRKAADSGVKIFLQDIGSVLTENGADADKAESALAVLKKNGNVREFVSNYDLPDGMKDLNIRDILISGGNRNIVYRKEQFQGRSVYMLVNTNSKDQTITVKFNGNGKTVRIWDPFTGDVRELEANDVSQEHLSLTGLTIGAGRALFVTIEE